jgi:hypothetical protein
MTTITDGDMYTLNLTSIRERLATSEAFTPVEINYIIDALNERSEGTIKLRPKNLREYMRMLPNLVGVIDAMINPPNKTVTIFTILTALRDPTQDGVTYHQLASNAADRDWILQMLGNAFEQVARRVPEKLDPVGRA